MIIQIFTLSTAIAAASVYMINECRNKTGLVRSIIYTITDSSVLINNKVVKEGEKIHGIRIVKIYPNKIEFEKNGKRWIQRVCQKPDPAWNEPNIETQNIQNE